LNHERPLKRGGKGKKKEKERTFCLRGRGKILLETGGEGRPGGGKNRKRGVEKSYTLVQRESVRGVSILGKKGWGPFGRRKKKRAFF